MKPADIVQFNPKYDSLFKGGPDCYICRENYGADQSCIIANVASEEDAILARRIFTAQKRYVQLRIVMGAYKNEIVPETGRLVKEPDSFVIDVGACEKHRPSLEKLLELTLKSGIIAGETVRQSRSVKKNGCAVKYS